MGEGAAGGRVRRWAVPDVDLAALREARFARGLFCVRCGGRRVQRWGRASGRQRYRCRRCGRTFSDLTGTLFAYSKRADVWGAYARLMIEGASVREAARQLGIGKDTAFRWRHRILATLPASTVPGPTGIVELHELRLAYSEKGRRRPVSGSAGRAPAAGGARPAPAAPARAVWAVWAVFARDRARGAAVGIGGLGRLAAPALRQWLLPVLGRRSTLVGRPGRFSAYGVACARTSARYRAAWARAIRREPGGFLLRSTAAARAKALRFRRWLRRFRGVATRYLEHYLRWHLALDSEPSALPGPAGAWLSRGTPGRGG